MCPVKSFNFPIISSLQQFRNLLLRLLNHGFHVHDLINQSLDLISLRDLFGGLFHFFQFFQRCPGILHPGLLVCSPVSDHALGTPLTLEFFGQSVLALMTVISGADPAWIITGICHARFFHHRNLRGSHCSGVFDGRCATTGKASAVNDPPPAMGTIHNTLSIVPSSMGYSRSLCFRGYLGFPMSGYLSLMNRMTSHMRTFLMLGLRKES